MNGYRYGGAVLEAMNAQIEANPVQNLPPIEKYTTETVTLVSNVKSEQPKEFLVSLSSSQYNEARNIIERYNKVNTTSVGRKMNMTEYINKAISMLNSVMAEEYLLKDDIESTKKQIQQIEKQERALIENS